MKEMIFNKANPNWSSDPVFVQNFLDMKQNYFNAWINQKGYVYMDTIYRSLGFDWDPNDNNFKFVKGDVDGIKIIRTGIAEGELLLTIMSYKTEVKDSY